MLLGRDRAPEDPGFYIGAQRSKFVGNFHLSSHQPPSNSPRIHYPGVFQGCEVGAVNFWRNLSFLSHFVASKQWADVVRGRVSSDGPTGRVSASLHTQDSNLKLHIRYRTRKCHLCEALINISRCAELQGYSSSLFPPGNQDLNSFGSQPPSLPPLNSQPGFCLLIPQDIFKIPILSVLLGAFPKPPIF